MKNKSGLSLSEVEKSPNKFRIVNMADAFYGDFYPTKVSSITKTLVNGRWQLHSVGGVYYKDIKDGQYEFVKASLVDKVFKLKEAKTPRTASKKNHIGIEIECVFPKSSRKQFVLDVLQQGLHNNVNIGFDSSVRCRESNTDGLELRVLVDEGNYKRIVPKILTLLKKHGARTNYSCGLHVHLDMRNRNVTEAYSELYKELPTLKKMVAKRRLRSDYCVQNTINNFQEAAKGGRYYMINAASYQTRKTLEIRMMEGTLNREKILTWINFLVSTVNKDSVNQIVPVTNTNNTNQINNILAG